MEKETPKVPMTIAAMWEEYAEHCVPTWASEVQRKETKQAFYSGIMCMLASLSELGSDTAAQEEFDTWMNNIQDEAVAYGNNLVAEHTQEKK